MSTNRPRFSIVIPTYRRREWVVRNVGALGAQTVSDFEVIVVDDGSDDGTAEKLRTLDTSFPLAVLEQENQGAARARNVGARTAGGEILLFLDDDMRADPALLAEHERSHREGADAVLGDLPLDPMSPPNLLSWGVGWWAESRCERLSEAGAEIRLDDLLTGQLSIAKQAFEELGGFDVSFTREGLFGGEDIDFGYRVLGAGKKVVFNPRAIAFQYYDISPATYLKRAREAGRSDWELVAKHPQLAERLDASPRFTTRRSRLLLQPFLIAPAALSWPLRVGAASIVRSRRNTPRLRRLFFAVRTLEYLRGRRNAQRSARDGSATVLAYHALSDLSRDSVLKEYGIDAETFAGQLDMLAARGHKFIGLDQLLTALEGRMPLPEKAILLTFDDAYADLLPSAVDILSQRRLPAVVFAVSGQLGGTNEWDRHLGAKTLQLLDTEGLETLVEAGIEIGSHSVTHSQLTKISARQADAELRDSADQLEAAGLPRPRAFAYPHGAWNGATAAAAAAVGYGAAFTVDQGRIEPDSNRYALPRIEVLASDSHRSLRLKLATAGWPDRVRDRLLALMGTKR